MNNRRGCPIKKHKEVDVVVFYARVEFTSFLLSVRTLRCVHSGFQTVGQRGAWKQAELLAGYPNRSTNFILLILRVCSSKPRLSAVHRCVQGCDDFVFWQGKYFFDRPRCQEQGA
ncbi:unnamed protein product [Periconia digitata]|uniref:Uncharacterized protein n=1 Tax=Periconia digitata TaxID=1303443 RepID=A0A9W4UUK8_9PLEO|nr:unnamed protein product [Periconia digitata]